MPGYYRPSFVQEGDFVLHIHHGNRLERLAGLLFEALDEVPGGPLQPRLVVVPNPGTGRWLQRCMAGERGVAANLELPLPAGFFWRVLRAWLPETVVSPFDRETLTWRILAALPAVLDRPDAASLARYLGGDDSDRRRQELALKIADLFDQYLVYRPEQVLAWEAGEEDHWQAQLWRAITREARDHRARLLARLAQAMAEGPPPQPAWLPEPVFFFGLNALPPVYLELLGLLGRHREVHLYRLDPCREYWADLADEARLARAVRDAPLQAELLDLGNPLLAAWGHVGQVFQDQLLGLEAEWHDHFEPPGGEGLLARVQRHLLLLEDGRARPAAPPPEALPSIQVHGVHGPLREVQVLHDCLLRCFEAWPDLEAHGILVMAPDMAAYAPYVEAVFGTAPAERQIPWTLADRIPGHDQPLAEALAWLLEPGRRRYTAAEILELLEVPAVQARLGLPAEALEWLRQWIGESGVRWGLHGDQRRALGLPEAGGLNSWAFGLDRLFLGLAAPVVDDPPLFGDTLPYSDLEGSQLPWLGALAALVQRLDRWRREAAEARPPAAWRETLGRLLDDLFDPIDQDEEALLQALRDRLDTLVQAAETGGFGEALSLSALAVHLRPVLEPQPSGHGFLQAGVTFADLQPMRALPFEVIALLGMTHDAFPRQARRAEFDLMAQAPRRGDRDRRRDDRYLFLECLISARRQLLIFHRGRDPRSDEPVRPAPMVDELVDYLEACWPGVSDQVRIQHPLQPFSPRQFEPGPLQSHDDRWLAPQPRQPAPFAAGLSAAPPLHEVDLESWLAFWKFPVEAFLRQRLGLREPRPSERPAEQEPFELDNLEDWQLRDRLLDWRLAGRSADWTFTRLRACGALPPGEAGRRWFHEAWARVEALAERIEAEGRRPGEPLEVNLTLGDWRLTGLEEHCDDQGIVTWRVGRLRPEDRLQLWLRHLVSCAGGHPAHSLFLAEDHSLRLPALPADQAGAHLVELLELYRQGLARPLRFFPRHAWALMTNEKLGDQAAQRELGRWSVRLAFRGDEEPLADPFAELAERVFAPLLAAREGAE